MKVKSSLVCALCATLVHAEASSRIYHRILNPAAPSSPFSLRAVIQTSQELGLVLIDSDNTSQLALDPDQLEGSLYQVALEQDGDVSESDWDLSSVKACHLTEMNSDTIRLHLSPSRKAFAIDYFVHPVRHDGSCPRKEPDSRTHISFTNTTLIINTLGVAPSPELRAPPQLSPQGEPIQPQPEQSFIQKYWMYIALGLVTLVLTGGGVPDEEQGGNAQGRASGGRATGR